MYPSDTIGILKFKVYLTDSTSTQLSLSNISFTTSSALAPDCIASIGDTGASFAYLYRCGDSILLEAMQDKLLFSISNIVPNPASTEITIGVVSSTVVPIKYELYDALGAVRASGEISSRASTVDVHALPSGMYYLRCSAQGYVQSRSISIAR
jgi:hypothetical protein